MAEKGIGVKVPRKEDQRFITGKGRYTGDINLQGQAHAYFVRSPHAHATITSIDKASAEGMPGVLAVLTAEDAQLAVDAGASGILVSNHGGRQIDGAPASLDQLPEIVAQVGGSASIALDSGIRRGTDVLKALALGAQVVVIGRVLAIHVADDCVLDAERAHVDTPRLDLVARSYGSDYVRSRDTFSLVRTNWSEWDGRKSEELSKGS